MSIKKNKTSLLIFKNKRERVECSESKTRHHAYYKVNRTTEAQFFRSSYHHKWLPYQILSGKPLKNAQFNPQTTYIWPKELFVMFSVIEIHTSQREAEFLIIKTDSQTPCYLIKICHAKDKKIFLLQKGIKRYFNHYIK